MIPPTHGIRLKVGGFSLSPPRGTVLLMDDNFDGDYLLILGVAIGDGYYDDAPIGTFRQEYDKELQRILSKKAAKAERKRRRKQR